LRPCGYCGGLILVGVDADLMGIPIRLDPRTTPKGSHVIVGGKAYPANDGDDSRARFGAHDCRNPCPDFRGMGLEATDSGNTPAF
jgi:hypothetical protein